jgi:hypothetical protein
MMMMSEGRQRWQQGKCGPGKGDGDDHKKDKWQGCNGKCGNDDSKGKKGYELVVTMKIKKTLSLTFYPWHSRIIVLCTGGKVVDDNGKGKGGTHSKGSNDDDDDDGRQWLVW